MCNGAMYCQKRRRRRVNVAVGAQEERTSDRKKAARYGGLEDFDLIGMWWRLESTTGVKYIVSSPNILC